MNKKIFHLNIKINSLNNQIEKFIVKKINKNLPEFYEKITQDELNEIYKLTLNTFKKNKTKFLSIKIIESIKNNFTREYMIYTHKKIISNEKKIISEYITGTNLLDLVKKYDGSPLNLLRIIFKSIYGKKLTQIIANKSILNSRDLNEFEWAISHDNYALVNQNEILAESIKFENKIKDVLVKLGVKFKTQSELAEEQIEQTNKAFNTPDFLILDDLFINNFKINWIDAKNFYGSFTKFMVNKIKYQTDKYINTWGTGCIIFSLGFNSNLHIDNIKMVNFNSFSEL